MNKILVPVDFSAASDWGFYYAHHLAQDFDGEVIVAHIYEPQSIEPSVQAFKQKDILDAQREALAAALRSSTVAPKGKTKSKPNVKLIKRDIGKTNQFRIDMLNYANREFGINPDLLIEYSTYYVLTIITYKLIIRPTTNHLV